MICKSKNLLLVIIMTFIVFSFVPSAYANEKEFATIYHGGDGFSDEDKDADKFKTEIPQKNQ